jgi:hypothetical protein
MGRRNTAQSRLTIHLDRVRHLVTWLLGVTCIVAALIEPGNHVGELVTGLLLLGYVQAGDILKNRLPHGSDSP